MKLWGLGQISPSEKSDILSQHREIYNGYKSMYPEISNTQPLYVQDFANDKGGLVVNNKGEVMTYRNFGINEQVESKEVCDECGAMQMSEDSGMCNECGGMMYEGECSECGWKGGDVMEYDMEEDIYDIEDLNPDEGFDYLEGDSNREDVFKYKGKKISANEQGGNADDMDVDDVEPAYDFESEGPGMGLSYPVNEDDDFEFMESAWDDWDELDEVDISGVQGVYGDMKPAYDFDSEGPGKAGPYQEFSYESVEEEEEEMDENWGAVARMAVPIAVGMMSKGETDEDWKEVDEDLMEEFKTQKQKINEMMMRMKILK
jgi:hypothetical protein